MYFLIYAHYNILPSRKFDAHPSICQEDFTFIQIGSGHTDILKDTFHLEFETWCWCLKLERLEKIWIIDSRPIF